MKRQHSLFKWTIIFLFLVLGSGRSAEAANVLLSWNANTEADLAGYKIYYGTSSRNYGTPTGVGNVTSYTVTGLNSGTYFFAVTAYDTSGNESLFSAEISLTITTADTTPPVISSIQATGITSSSATITWTTNEVSNTQVEYGTTTTYGSSSSLNSSLLTAHSVNLTGLSASTVYHYRVKSRDGAGNLATSGDSTFMTGTPPSGTGCDVNSDGTTNAVDLQGVINAILSASNSTTYDINHDGTVNVLDLQLLSNVILGVGVCP